MARSVDDRGRGARLARRDEGAYPQVGNRGATKPVGMHRSRELARSIVCRSALSAPAGRARTIDLAIRGPFERSKYAGRERALGIDVPRVTLQLASGGPRPAL